MNFDLVYLDRKFTPRMALVQKWINRFLTRMGMRATIEPMFTHSTDMVSSLQKVNIFHLLNEVLFYRVPGEVVELGCFEGQSSVLLAQILKANHSRKQLWLYDDFQHQLGINGPIKSRLQLNFQEKHFNFPRLVEGDIFDTIPAQLPASIAFAHIDLGVGNGAELHYKTLTHALESVYARLQPGGVCMVMDYHVNGVTIDGHPSNPATTAACDAFLNDKPEKMFVLPGGEFSHGYFRKSL